jgi:Fur family transcriptional regulator, peroxide stress response regulator
MSSQHSGIQEQLRRFEALCRDQGLPVTVQRRTVLETVLGRDDHPTADQIYEEVVARVAGVSRTTVYRVLDLLVRFGMITKACHPGAMARFDGNTDRHHHLICLRCDRVIDLIDERLDALELPDTSHLNFEITDLRVQLYGVCADCRNEATITGPITEETGATLHSKTKEQTARPQERKKRP